MKRQAKKLQSKSRTHDVTPNPDGTFTVTSGASGNRYTVHALADGTFRCGCKWADYHDTPCSHTLSVQEWLERAGRRSLSFWADPKAAARQHRPTARIGPGLWTTSRRAP